MLEKTLTSTGSAELDAIFNASHSFTIEVPLWEYGHFDDPIVEWKSEGHRSADQWVAFRVAGFGVDASGVTFLQMECKAFNQDAGVSEMSDPLYALLPIGWMVSGG